MINECNQKGTDDGKRKLLEKEDGTASQANNER